MKILFSFCLLVCISTFVQAQTLPILQGGTYNTKIFNEQGTHTVAYDNLTNKLFSCNTKLNTIDVIDYSDINNPIKTKSIDISQYVAKVTGVASSLGLLAVIGNNGTAHGSGKLLFFNSSGNYLKQYSVGAAPKMVAFSPGGSYITVVNEGAPSNDYLNDPLGTISLMNISSGVNSTPQSAMADISFYDWDSLSILDPQIRVFGNNGTAWPSQDLEPEFLAFNKSFTQAYFTLPENNAIGSIDIQSDAMLDPKPLGFKDFGMVGLDASDVNQKININTYAGLYGMYQPTGISTFKSGGLTYLATANEGAIRDYSGYSEKATVGSLVLDAVNFPNWANWQQDSIIGQLQVTNTLGSEKFPGVYDSLFCFGGRSFSIWDTTGTLIWDSGDEFEQTLASLQAANFNSASADNNSYKASSIVSGCKPKGIAIGEVDGVKYAFIGLSEMGGIMVYDMSNPMQPQFETYLLNRNFSVAANDPAAGDLGTHGLEFVPAAKNPSGLALLFVANQVSGNVTVYSMGVGVGLDEGYTAPNADLYPNPSTGVFHSDETHTFEIFDAQGKKVMNVTDVNKIDLSQQPNGYYIIKTSEGVTRRVVKK